MNMVVAYLIVGITVIIAYLLGSINSSIIVGRLHGIEIREQGSKNAGLTNTLRVLGKKEAVFVLLGDILKGVIAILIAKFLTPYVLNLITGVATDMNEHINNALKIEELRNMMISTVPNLAWAKENGWLEMPLNLAFYEQSEILGEMKNDCGCNMN